MRFFREEFKVSTIPIIALALGLVLLMALISFVLFQWQKGFPASPVSETTPPQSPRLQVEFESGQLARNLKTEQQARLSTYDWNDPQHRFAKVPIQRAMEFLVENPTEGNPK